MASLSSSMPSVTSTTRKSGLRFVKSAKLNRNLASQKRPRTKRKQRAKLRLRSPIPRPLSLRAAKATPFLMAQLCRSASTPSLLPLALLLLILPLWSQSLSMPRAQSSMTAQSASISRIRTQATYLMAFRSSFVPSHPSPASTAPTSIRSSRNRL